MMMGHREKLKGAEHDALTRWRKYLPWNHSQRHRAKTAHSRRVRRLAKQMLREDGES